MSTMVLCYTGCGSEEAEVEATSIALGDTELSLELGEIYELQSTVEPSNASINWSSSDASIATVNEGLITGISIGTVDVVAVSGGVSAVCTVDITDGTTIDLTGLSIDQSNLNLQIGDTEQLTATLDPEEATNNVVWASSDESIVSVSEDGLITANAAGSVSITASAHTFTDAVSVSVSGVSSIDNSSLMGSDYYVVVMEETSYESIADKVAFDFRPDGETGGKNLFIWDNTFGDGIPTGNSFYNLPEAWVSLVVGSVGWSGAGYNIGSNVTADMTALSENPDDYYLHIGIKSEGNAPYLFILADGNAEARVAIGGNYTDGGVTYTSYAEFERDGLWQEIEIPVSHLISLGLSYDAAFSDKNVFAFLAGGTAGTTLDLDAVFFYKK